MNHAHPVRVRRGDSKINVLLAHLQGANKLTASIQGWRAARLPLATIFDPFGVSAIRQALKLDLVPTHWSHQSATLESLKSQLRSVAAMARALRRRQNQASPAPPSVRRCHKYP